jgi:NADH-quinone oxidoreductase subunit L
MSSPLIEYWPAFTSWAIPFIGAILMPVFARAGDKIRDYIAVLFGAGAAVSTLAMLPWLFEGHTPGDVSVVEWVNFLGRPLQLGVLVDPLSIMICNVVAVITFLIMVYSVGYMAGDPGLTRYWFLFLYFLGSMLLLVISNNLILTLVGWEGVGICSYGLIGYYYRDDKERWLGGPPPTKMYGPSECGMKAFVVTGLGDVFILGAIFIIFNFAGTFNYTELIHTASEWLPEMAAIPGLLALTSIMLLGGPIGKSAQFPLHEWLPEAMAGPTSVSALIHAATMVKAGVYLVARMSPIFYIGTWHLHLPEAQTYFIAIAIIGGFTTFLAASQALVSIELKKILAYSTVSQIGYMMLALGLGGLSEGAYVSGLTAGVFHLVSHALFKGALFLGAGSVIHAMHSIYTFDMGNLRTYMPKTYWLMLLATLSLSGIPPLSGFWSKDSVFISAIIAGTPLAQTLLLVATISAAMTFGYSLRYVWQTFLAPTSKHVEVMEHHGHPPHEAPAVMWTPIAILVGLVVIIGLLGLAGQFTPSLNPELFIEGQIEHALHSILPHEVEVHVTHVESSMKATALGLSGIALGVGGLAGWYFYLARKIDSWAWVQASNIRKSIWSFLWNRWYLNETYYNVFVYGLIGFSNGLNKYLEGNLMKLNNAVPNGLLDIAYGLNKYIEGALMGLNDTVPAVASSTWNQVKKIQTGVISINIIYIGLLFLFLVFTFIVRSA